MKATRKKAGKEKVGKRAKKARQKKTLSRTIFSGPTPMWRTNKETHYLGFHTFDMSTP
jgi:hypothetical protein